MHFIENIDKEFSEIIFATLNGLFEYLKQLLIFEDVLQTARFQIYELERGIRNCLQIDS